MKYNNNIFTVEKCNLNKVVKRFETPIFCYSEKKITENINNFRKNFKSFSPVICFSTKSNCNLKILKMIKRNGLGADVVSKGELMIALKAGISSKKIVFSGVGKTRSELIYAIEKNILLINSESKSEILEIESIAKSKNKKVDIGIRLNPNTDAKTLKQISTGKKENKFGINEKTFIEVLEYIKSSKFLNLKCLSVHIGSQILSHRPYQKMLNVVNRVIKKSKFNFEYIDLGGGMGIDYVHNKSKLNLKKYSQSIQKILDINSSKIIFEPGRFIIGNTAILITKILYIKENTKKDFIILDAAMNDLIRPALYGAQHKIISVNKTTQITNKVYEFVGPICESTDKFLTVKRFQKLNEKSFVVICDVGAYGISLASNYNIRPKPIEILIKNSKIQVIKKRQKLSELI